MDFYKQMDFGANGSLCPVELEKESFIYFPAIKSEDCPPQNPVRAELGSDRGQATLAV